MNPHIFYWKWCEEDLDRETMRYRTMDIIKNTEFDLIYIALHGLTDTNILNISVENIAVLKECNKIFNDHGRKVFIDISRFNNLKIRDEHMKGVERFVGKLDENGEFVCDAGDFTEVLNCWAVDMIDSKKYII